MHILLINNDSDDLESVIHAINHRNNTYNLVAADELQSVNMSVYDLVVLLGGIWYDDPTLQADHYANELELITKTKLPLLGICLGMQLIVSSYGGELMKLKREYHGKKRVQLTELGEELLKWPENIIVYENHSIGVTICPPQFESLAHSEECVEILKHKTLPIVGVQFHPEKLAKSEHSAIIWDSLFSLMETH